ncbi:hypothetical protein NMG60_11007229 [Bertholletia excelsa]
MGAHPAPHLLPLQPLHESPLHSPRQNGEAPSAPSFDSDQTSELPTPSFEPACNCVKSTTIKSEKNNKKKKKKKLSREASDTQSSSTSSAFSSSHLIKKRIRVSSKQRNPRALIGSSWQNEGEVDALALPLGMSFAAVVAQVVERKDATGETIAVDHLSKICTSAVRESIANVFDNKYDLFVRNFEKSFRSTLMTLRSINESSCCSGEHPRQTNKASNYLDAIPPISISKEDSSTYSSDIQDHRSEVVQHTIDPVEDFGPVEETQQNTQTDSIVQELALYHGEIGQQLTSFTSHTRHSEANQSALSTLERSIIEQARSNDLKTFEIGLTMRKLQLKEKQLALNSDLNFLERCKLSMGLSKASFRTEKFKIELEETRRTELLKKCIDCLVAGLFVMLALIFYGAYVFSHHRITEATASCTPSQDSKSWWIPNPMASFNSGLQILWCHLQVFGRILMGLLMVLAILYLLFQRSAISTRTMPIASLLLLGGACGIAGKHCIDMLGGSGSHWLIYWEVLCLLHLFSNVCTKYLYFILHGPVMVSQEANGKPIFPYRIRQLLFYTTLLVVLPLLGGLMPFASLAEWKDHFSQKVTEFFEELSD